MLCLLKGMAMLYCTRLLESHRYHVTYKYFNYTKDVNREETCFFEFSLQCTSTLEAHDLQEYSKKDGGKWKRDRN